MPARSIMALQSSFPGAINQRGDHRPVRVTLTEVRQAICFFGCIAGHHQITRLFPGIEQSASGGLVQGAVLVLHVPLASEHFLGVPAPYFSSLSTVTGRPNHASQS